MTKTKKLLAAARLKQREAARQMEIDYPIGFEVSWTHGEHIRRGQVESYGYGTVALVRTASGKRIPLEIDKVRE